MQVSIHSIVVDSSTFLENTCFLLVFHSNYVYILKPTLPGYVYRIAFCYKVGLTVSDLELVLPVECFIVRNINSPCVMVAVYTVYKKHQAKIRSRRVLPLHLSKQWPRRDSTVAVMTFK